DNTPIVLGQVALATFPNPAGLSKVGGTSFSESLNSGTAQLGEPQSGGRGRIIPESLEMSNVDLVQEFTEMITTQRGFQANSRVITTSDELLQETLSIKR
ncbi:MAG: flagellar hook-basal body complex protein, partial [Limnochordia bacterium]|nr:flagellar hook-basal body complex protein [Limnochordia bacterium]